jgi:hypothetical protein
MGFDERFYLRQERLGLEEAQKASNRALSQTQLIRAIAAIPRAGERIPLEVVYPDGGFLTGHQHGWSVPNFPQVMRIPNGRN